MTLFSSWGKHKHRRFVKEVDPGSTASVIQKGDDPSSPAFGFRSQSLPIASSTTTDLPLNLASKFQTQTLFIASSMALDLPLNQPSEFQTQTLPIILSTAADLVKDRTTPKIDHENKISRKSKRITVKSPKKERTVLSLVVPISKREIEKDFWKMIGKKPPTRPKKRPRVVQQQLDTLFPGLRLAKVLTDQYDVPEPPPCKRKINGLRGLMDEGYDWDEI